MNAKKKILSLLLLGVLGATSCSLREISSNPSSSLPSSDSSTSSGTTTPSHEGNTYGEGISDEEKKFLGQIAEGDITKAEFAATGVLNAKYEVRKDNTLTALVYKGTVEVNVPKGPVNFSVYVTISATDYTVLDYVTDGKLTTHGMDEDFADDALGLIGTTGEGTSISHATITSDAIIDICKAASDQAKADLSGEVIPPDPEPEIELSLSETTIVLESTRYGYDQKELKAFVTNYDGEDLDADLTWKSSDETIVRIATNVQEGTITLVSGMHPGSATITCSIGGKTATCSVTVLTASVETSDVTVKDVTISQILSGEYIDRDEEGEIIPKYYRVSGIATNFTNDTSGSMTLVDKDDTSKTINVNGLAKDGNDMDALFHWDSGELHFTNPQNFGEQYEAREGSEIQIVGILSDAGFEGYLEKVVSNASLYYPLEINDILHGSIARVDTKMVTDPETGELVYDIVEGSEREMPKEIGYQELVYFTAKPDAGYVVDTIMFNGATVSFNPLGTLDGELLYSVLGKLGPNEMNVTFKLENPQWPTPEKKDSTISAMLDSEADMVDHYYTIEGVVTSLEPNPRVGDMVLIEKDTGRELTVSGLASSFDEDLFPFDSETGRLSFENPENLGDLFVDGVGTTFEEGDLIKVSGIYTLDNGFEGAFEEKVMDKQDIPYAIDMTLQTFVQNDSGEEEEIETTSRVTLVDVHYDDVSGEYVVDGPRASETATYGEVVYFQVEAEEGYGLDAMTIDGTPVSLSAHDDEGTLYSFTAGVKNDLKLTFREVEKEEGLDRTITDTTIAELLSDIDNQDRTKLYRVTGVLHAEDSGMGYYWFSLSDTEDPSQSIEFARVSKSEFDSNGEFTLRDNSGAFDVDYGNDNLQDIFGEDKTLKEGCTATFVIAINYDKTTYGYFEKYVADPVPGGDEETFVPVHVNFTNYMSYGEATLQFYDESGTPIDTPTEAKNGSTLSFIVTNAPSWGYTYEVNGTEYTAYDGDKVSVLIDGETTIDIYA